MAKIRREQAVDAALELLDEVGLDALTTRRLAQKLGVESATLYWHFRDKSVLLAEMAAVVLERCHTFELPDDPGQWSAWFAGNARSFRRALLAYRDGARLHAGSPPAPAAVEQLVRKVAYLMRAGLPEQTAWMAMLTVGQFTIGCALEQQAAMSVQETPATTPAQDDAKRTQRPGPVQLMPIDPEDAFEFGLGLIVDGLKRQTEMDAARALQG